MSDCRGGREIEPSNSSPTTFAEKDQDRAFFADKDFPPGFTLVGTVTQDDVSRTICIWDAPSVDELQRTLDEMFGDAAVNDCFVADPSRSAGMPAPQTTAAQG